MRRVKTILLMTAAAGLLLPAVGTAQRKQKQRPSRGAGLGSDFTRGPAVGQKLPDIAAYDAQGKPFRLGSLKGSYTVLVFGCLT